VSGWRRGTDPAEKNLGPFTAKKGRGRKDGSLRKGEIHIGGANGKEKTRTGTGEKEREKVKQNRKKQPSR